MTALEKKNKVAGRCNALKQARQTLVRTVEIGNRPNTPFRLTPEQEAELQACAVIISRIESTLWSRWNWLDQNAD